MEHKSIKPNSSSDPQRTTRKYNTQRGDKKEEEEKISDSVQEQCRTRFEQLGFTWLDVWKVSVGRTCNMRSELTFYAEDLLVYH